LIFLYFSSAMDKLDVGVIPGKFINSLSVSWKKIIIIQAHLYFGSSPGRGRILNSIKLIRRT